ncbi:hypothetical protein [Geodermatophilus sp. URMC 65]
MSVDRLLADVVAHLGASGQVGLLDAMAVRLRRPAAGRAGRPVRLGQGPGEYG